MKFKYFLIIFSIFNLNLNYLVSGQSFFTVNASKNPNLKAEDASSPLMKDTSDQVILTSVEKKGLKIEQEIPKQAPATFWLHLPVNRLHVTSAFGLRFHPVLDKWLKHTGIDLRSDYQPIYSISYGIIEQIGQDKRSGKYVVINNFNQIETIFCHLSEIMVKRGDTLKAGQLFAISGATGTVTGPHLHFGLKVRGKYVNPLPLLLAIEQKTFVLFQK